MPKDDNTNNDQYILEHYKSLRERFTSQGDRLWKRFHFFLTVNVPLVGVLLTLGDMLNFSLSKVIIPCLGLIWSGLWYLIGAQDLWFYDNARIRLSDYTKEFILENIKGWDNTKERYQVPDKKKRLCFKIDKYGVTTFASITPVVFFFVWVLLVFSLLAIWIINWITKG